MKNGFDFEMLDTVFRDCFIECKSYKNVNLKIILYVIYQIKY